MPEEIQSSSAPVSKPRRSPFIWVVVAFGAILLVVGSCAGFGYGIFVRRSDHAVIRILAGALPIPAGRVGSKTLLYRDYLRERDTMKKFLASPAAAAQELNMPIDATLEKNILEKMMYQAAIEELGTQKNIAVSDDELRKYFTDVVTAASSTTPDMGVYLHDNFGWTEEDFRQNVLRPSLLEQKLGTQMATEAQGDEAALSTYIETRLAKPDCVRYLRF